MKLNCNKTKKNASFNSLFFRKWRLHTIIQEDVLHMKSLGKYISYLNHEGDAVL